MMVQLNSILGLIVLLFSSTAFSQTTQTFTANGTFTVPCGVTSIEVDCWGGGGAGGAADLNNGKGAGGGAGGAHATKTFAVVAGQTYTITVGAGGIGNNSGAGGNGGNTTLTGVGGTVVAEGGTGGAEANNGAVAGGTSGTGSSNGTPATAGSNGTGGTTTNAGAGGAAAFMGGLGGGTAGTNVGNGGDGGNASAVGGGGGGGFSGNNTNRFGGDGFRGEVWVTYTATGPGNDAVCSATALPVNGTTLAGQTNCGSTSLWSGGCVGVGETEVWYTVTITGTNNTLTVNFPTNSFGGGNVGLQINTNDVACPANTSMTNLDDYCGTATGAITLSNLSAGTYYLGVSTTLANQGAFTINATQSTVLGFPDDPCNAPLVPSNYCSAATSHTNVSALTYFSNNFFSSNGCGDGNQNEVFFKFVATTNSIDITALQGSIGGPNSEISLMETTPDDNNCNDPYSILAASCPAWGTSASFTDILTIGNTYYIAIDHKGNSSLEGTFGICLNPFNYVPPVGSGIACGTAIPITTPFLDVSTTVGSGNEWNNACTYIAANLVGGATTDFILPGNGTPDKFYSITVPAGGGYYSYSLAVTSTLANYVPTLSIVSTCPTINQADWDQTSGLCEAQNGITGTDGQNSRASGMGYLNDSIPCTGIWLPGGSYYIIIDHARQVTDGFSGVNSQIITAAQALGYSYEFRWDDLAQASNNECTGVSTIVNATPLSGNNAGCNYSYGPNDPNSSEFCAFSTENLAWFSFTTAAGQTSVGLTLSNVVGDVQWGVVQGPCGGPYTSAGANALNNPADGFSAANDPCDRVSTTASYSTTITGLTPNTQYWFIADGNAGTPSSFDITMTNITLPIEFSKFETKNEGKYISINWETTSERNNDLFIIERSFDGTTWEEIGYVDGAGNSNTLNSYSLKDYYLLKTGERYYRIKQVDFDKNYSYSEVSTEFIDYTTINLSPNPVNNELNISIVVDDKNYDATISITDISGKTIKLINSKLVKGINNITVNMEGLSPGMYYVTLEKENTVLKNRFMKN